MRIIRLQASGIKRLVAVDITPDPGMNRVGGWNGEGKSSLLDTIKMALGGASEIPMKPLRTGEEYGAIRIEAGEGETELRVTRYFNDDGTTSLKVQSADGGTYGQGKLSDIIGAISFDPVRFADMDPKDQVAELRRLAPLSVDLDALAAADKADYAARTVVNRDGLALKVRAEAIEVSGIVPPQPDRDAILARLSSAGETNAAIERDKAARANNEREISDLMKTAASWRESAERLRREADEADASARLSENTAHAGRTRLDALPPLPDPADTAQLSADLAQADRDLALLGRIAERNRIVGEMNALREKSTALTQAMAAREVERAKALAEAKMPVEGLSLGEVGGQMVVTYNGEPFSQSSRAEQIRVSMRIAMAANPKLRVMTIRDGSLVDERGFKLISEIAAEGGYQVFFEVVGEGDDNGIIIEDGRVKGAADPERVEPPRRRKAKGEEPATADQPQPEPPVEAGPKPEPEVAQRQPRPRSPRSISTPKPEGGLL